MNLHITPSFNIDRLCKTASVLLFLGFYIHCEFYGIKNVFHGFFFKVSGHKPYTQIYILRNRRVSLVNLW